MENLRKLEVWFVTGSQHLYGPETLKKVAADSKIIADELDKSKQIPVRVLFKPVSSPHPIQFLNSVQKQITTQSVSGL
jgi:L-arabinose isomerase